MASEHDLMLWLPDAPDPSPKAREAAIEAALHRFDERAARLDRKPVAYRQ